MQQSDLEHALIVANRLVEINANNPQAWLALADVYRAVGKPAEAEAAALKARALDPKATTTWESAAEKP